MANESRYVHGTTSEKSGIAFTTATVTLPGPSTDGSLKKMQQSYIDRVRNYVPVEVIAFFIFANSMVNKDAVQPIFHSSMVPSLSDLTIDGFVALACVLVGIIATVFYVSSAATAASANGDMPQEAYIPWKIQAVMSVLAFLIWMYALDAKAFLLVDGNIQNGALSGFLLGSFTLFSGMVLPKVKKDADS